MNSFKQIVFFFVIQLFFIEDSCAQINLVKNSSFEDTISCPSGSCLIDPFVWFWKNPTASSPDYYNGCVPYGTGCSVPIGPVEYQYAYTGNAYCGIFAYDKVNNDEREYIQGQIKDSLIAGESYTLSFYANLANFSRYSVNQLGAYLSDLPISSGTADNLPYSPQIFNIPTRQLNDTLRWILIKGDFVANGTEKYITIGNFSDDANTDTLLFNSSPFGTAKIAYYYIDEVSVMKKFMIPSLIGGNNIFEINGLPEKCILYLYNSLGQIVYENENYNNDLNSINLRSGIYYYYVELPYKEIYKGKLCIIH